MIKMQNTPFNTWVLMSRIYIYIYIAFAVVNKHMKTKNCTFSLKKKGLCLWGEL